MPHSILGALSALLMGAGLLAFVSKGNALDFSDFNAEINF